LPSVKNSFFHLRVSPHLCASALNQFPDRIQFVKIRGISVKGFSKRCRRFPCGRLHPKAAWRFASRRSPKSVVAAQAALGLSAYSGVAATRLYAVSILG
jgi:hypothetical protein